MPEPEWWTGLKKRKEPLPGFGAGEPQWIKDFWKWFMGRNQQRQPTTPTTPTAPEHFPGAPGQTYTVGQPQQQGARMVIEQEAGYDVLVMYDENGKRTIIEVIGRSQPGGMAGQGDEWFRANQKAVMGSMARQYQGMEEQITKAQQAQQATQWELMRQQQLGQWNEPQDWIKRWMLQQKRNPYKRQPQTPDESVAQIAGELASALEGGAAGFMPLSTFGGSTEPDFGQGREGEAPSEEYLEAQQLRQEAYQEHLKGLEGQLKNAQKVLSTWAGPETKQRAKTPPTPPWLAQWYPGQLQTGQPIGKLSIATPSMQWWERQPESARQGWLGFAEFSGAEPMDILSEMQRQLLQPRQPTQRRVARQRTSV